jgi:hypothetical protein
VFSFYMFFLIKVFQWHLKFIIVFFFFFWHHELCLLDLLSVSLWPWYIVFECIEAVCESYFLFLIDIINSLMSASRMAWGSCLAFFSASHFLFYFMHIGSSSIPGQF